MERFEYSRYGGPEVMSMARFELPPLKDHELAVRVVSASVNAMDWKIRNGVTKLMTGSKFPRALGTDYAGVVEAIGRAVMRFKPGDEILGTVTMKGAGTFAPRVIAPEAFAVLKPAAVSFEQAATLPIAGVTAWQALVKAGGLKAGQRVFINGAAGGVGQAAVGIARALGAQWIAGRVNPAMARDAESLGLDEAFDYTQPLAARLRGRFDVVFDVHGGLRPGQSGRLVARNGKVVDVTPSAGKIMRAILSRKHKLFFADMKAPNLQQVVDLAASGALRMPVFKKIVLDDLPQMMSELERGCSVRGKVVINIAA